MITARAAMAVFALLGCAAGVCLGAEPNPPVLESFEVQEHFGISHPKQIIDFDLEAPAVPSAVHLVDDAGRAVPFQLLAGGKKLAVETDLPAHQSRRWRLVRGPGPRVSPSGGVAIRELRQDGGTGYEITNGLT